MVMDTVGGSEAVSKLKLQGPSTQSSGLRSGSSPVIVTVCVVLAAKPSWLTVRFMWKGSQVGVSPPGDGAIITAPESMTSLNLMITS